MTNQDILNIKLIGQDGRCYDFVACDNCSNIVYTKNRKTCPCCKYSTTESPDATIGQVGNFLDEMYTYKEKFYYQDVDVQQGIKHYLKMFYYNTEKDRVDKLFKYIKELDR